MTHEPDRTIRARLHVHEATEQLGDAMDALPPELRVELNRREQDALLSGLDELRRLARALERGLLRPPQKEA